MDRKTLSLVLTLAAGLFFLAGFLGVTAWAAPTACSVPSGSYATIQAAVDDPACDVINVGAGTFFENIDIDRTVEIRGAGIGTTNVDGSTTGRVFTIENIAGVNVVTLADMLILNGDATTETLSLGGGALVDRETLILDNVNVQSNVASSGGGVATWGSGARLIIQDSSVELNVVPVGAGNISVSSGGFLTATNSIISSALSGTGIFSAGDVYIIGSRVEGNFAGGIDMSSGNLHLENSLLGVNANYGIRVLNPSATPVFVEVISSTIQTSQLGFGGVGNGINVTDNVHLIVTDSAINNNVGTGIVGTDPFGFTPVMTVTGTTVFENLDGGIANEGDIVISTSEILTNTRTSIGLGGGVYHASNTTRLKIIESEIRANEASVCGGGVYSSGDSTSVSLLIETSTIAFNNAPDGGGICIQATSTNIRRSAIGANEATAGDGGGLYYGRNDFVGLGNLKMTNTTISNNTATEDGGGIFLFSGDAEITNLTIARNIADSDNNASGDGGGYGLGIAPGTLDFVNTIVAENELGSGVEDDCVGTINSLGTNLIGVATGCVGLIGSDLSGTAGSPLDPRIGVLKNNGGTTPTHALQANSPAADAGQDGVCAVAPVQDVDQRGYDRDNADGNGDGGGDSNPCDIGAFERGGAEPPTPTPTATATATDTPTATATDTATATSTDVAPTNTATNTPTATHTGVAPTNTATPTPTNTSGPPVNTATPTPTSTGMAPTATSTASVTPFPGLDRLYLPVIIQD